MSCHVNNLCFSVLLLALVAHVSAATRFDEYTNKYKDPTHPAIPLATGFIGGGGDEYLSGAAFLPDGTLLLAGTAYGPTFDPAGIPVAVLGHDDKAPDYKMPMKPGKKGGEPSPLPQDWSYVDGAGFIVRLPKGYARADKAVRFPWGSGSLTAIETDAMGGIYVAGICGKGFAALTAAKAGGSNPVIGGKAPTDIFVGKVTSDLSGFVWCLTFKDDAGAAPKLQALDDGSLNLTCANAYHLSADGQVTKASQIALTNSWVRGVDPLTHSSATGGDGNTNTGYEPWRKPVLYIFNDQGEHTDEFYRWNEKLVGMNYSRQVSDSDIRCLAYDKGGNLLVCGWSDGGNTVLECLPYDLKVNITGEIKRRTGKPCGLGFSTWGANAGSFCHLVKINPMTGEPLGKTLFVGYLSGKNSPSGLSCDLLASAADNSLMIAGGSAYGLIETGSNKVNTFTIGEDYIGGPFIAILTETMGDIRFSSCLPGGGQVALKRHGSGGAAHTWANSRMVDGKALAVFVCGAVKNDKFKLIDSAQPAFGGGTLDGQYVVLSMDSLAQEPATSPAEGGEGNPAKPVKPPQTAAALTGTFNVSAGMSKEWSVLVLRDRSGKKWPAYYMAAPKGTAQVDAAGKGSFVLVGPGDRIELSAGSRQDVRLGGECITTRIVKDKDGKDQNQRLFPELELAVTLDSRTTCSAVVKYNGKTVNLTGGCSIRESKPSGPGINLSGSFTTTKGELGLAKDDPEALQDAVSIEFWCPGRP